MQFVPRPPAAGVPHRHDLLVLPAERAVSVTGEQHHQDVLRGRHGRVVVALHPAPVSTGKYAGEPGLAVLLDGRRVGELTRLMAQRYLPLVHDAAARGRWVGCEALLRPDHRGVQVELRLPAADRTPRPIFPTPAPPSRPPVVGPASPAPGAPAPWAAGPAVAFPPRPQAVGPVPPFPTAVAPRPGPVGRPRRHRRAVWAGAAVVGLLALVGIVGQDGQDPAPRTTTVAAALPTSTAVEPTPAAEPASTPTGTTTASATPTAPVRADGGAVAVPARTSTRTTTKPTTEAAPKPTTKPSTKPTTKAAAPRTSTPSSSPATRTSPPAADPPPARSGCDPNYSGCVPVASDVDCEGGSGNGPAYVAGPVRVTGDDVYELDADHDGIACE